MNKHVYLRLVALLMLVLPLSMNATSFTSTKETPLVTGCDGVTVVAGAGSITVSGLGTYSHIQVFTPDFAAQVFNQELTTSTVTIPIATAGNYVVKIWSNPNPAAFCESNFPVTVGGGGGTPPVANPDNATTPQGQPVAINVIGNDQPNGTLQMIMLVSNPSNGTLIANATGFNYAPNAGFSGTDQFTYKIVTSSGTSNTTTVTVVVTPQATPPVANPDNATTPQGQPVTINQLTNDVLNGALQLIMLQSNPSNGSVILSGNSFVYTPAAGFSGTDQFTYSIVTSSGTSNTTTVTIVVTAPQNPPTANPDNATTNQNVAVTIPVLTNDNFNGGSFTMLVVMSQPANGTATVVGNQVVYTPNAGFCGSNTFTYKLVTSGGSSTTTVTVNVICPNPCDNDVTPPTITCPADIVKDVYGMSGTCWTINYANATATDNCGPVTVVRESGHASGTCLPVGVCYVVFKATDAKGNVARCTLTIRITKINPCDNDVTPPTIHCPADFVKDVTGMSGTTWLVNYATPTYSDNCGILSCVRESGYASGSWVPVGTHPVVFKVTDKKGNVSRCTFYIKIIKNTVAACPVNVTFKNWSGCTIDLYWNNNGTKVWYKKILPWQSHTQSTYKGHVWLMCNSSNTVLSTCTVNSCSAYTHSLSSCSNWWFAQSSETFTAQANAEPTRTRLEWVSNTGSKNDFFTVEKLNDITGDFDALATMNSKNSDEMEHYSTFDNAPTEGDNVYRVKVTYNNGETKTTDLLKVNFKGLNTLRVFPNPASDAIELDVRAYKGADVAIYLYNSFGQQVAFKNIDKVTENTVSMDIASQSVGNYVVRLAAKGKRDAVQKINIAR